MHLVDGADVSIKLLVSVVSLGCRIVAEVIDFAIISCYCFFCLMFKQLL